MSDSRVAIVTGSANGIGKAIALRLATDRCDIVVNGLPHQTERLRSTIQEIEATGRRATLFVGSVTVEDDFRLLVEHAVSTFGGVDIVCPLVHNNDGVNYTNLFANIWSPMLEYSSLSRLSR